MVLDIFYSIKVHIFSNSCVTDIGWWLCIEDWMRKESNKEYVSDKLRWNNMNGIWYTRVISVTRHPRKILMFHFYSFFVVTFQRKKKYHFVTSKFICIWNGKSYHSPNPQITMNSCELLCIGPKMIRVSLKIILHTPERPRHYVYFVFCIIWFN